MSFQRAFLLACGGMILLGALVNFSGIVLRLTVVLSYDVFTDLTIWLTIWGALLAAGPLVVLADGHVSIQFIPERLGPRSRTAMRILALLIGLGTGLVMAYAGWGMVESLYDRGALFVRYVNVPQWIVKSCIPISMAVFALYCLIALIVPLGRSGGGDAEAKD